MKKLFILLLVGAFQNTVAQSPDPDFNDKMAFNESRNFRKSATFTESVGYADYDLTYQRLNFTIDPAVNYISGSVISQVKCLKENMGQIQFDLSTSLTVDSVKFDLKNTDFQHISDKINIQLPGGIQANSFHLVEIGRASCRERV